MIARALILTMALTGLSACASGAPTPTGPPPLAPEARTAETFPPYAERVQVGMTRDQVAAVLGPYSLGLTLPEAQPICDSYTYAAGDQTLHVQVWYDRTGLVESVRVGQTSGCAIV